MSAPQNPVRQRSTVYSTFHDEFVIDAPAATVWANVLRYPTWQEFAIVDREEGEADQEGELVVLKKIEGGLDRPPYYARTVKLEPGHRIIWKCYQYSDDELPYHGFVEFVVTPLGENSSRFNYSLIYQFEHEHETPEELVAWKTAQDTESQRIFDLIFPKLKKLSETGAW